MNIFSILFCILAINSIQCGEKTNQNKQKEKRARDFEIDRQARRDQDNRVFRNRNVRYSSDRHRENEGQES